MKSEVAGPPEKSSKSLYGVCKRFRRFCTWKTTTKKNINRGCKINLNRQATLQAVRSLMTQTLMPLLVTIREIARAFREKNRRKFSINLITFYSALTTLKSHFDFRTKTKPRFLPKSDKTKSTKSRTVETDSIYIHSFASNIPLRNHRFLPLLQHFERCNSSERIWRKQRLQLRLTDW